MGETGHTFLLLFSAPLQSVQGYPFLSILSPGLYYTGYRGQEGTQNGTGTFAENIFNVYFCFHPKRTNILQSKSSLSMLLIATSNHPFSCGLVSIEHHPLQSVNICPHLLPFIILHRHHCIHLQQASI